MTRRAPMLCTTPYDESYTPDALGSNALYNADTSYAPDASGPHALYDAPTTVLVHAAIGQNPKAGLARGAAMLVAM